MGFNSDPGLFANQLPISVEIPNNQPELIDTIDLLYKRIASSVNSKEGALYSANEVSTFQQFFSSDPQIFKPTYRKCFSFGPIGPGLTGAIVHGITNIVQFTRIYGTCITAFPDYRPLPYASVTANSNIELRVDANNIYIVVGAASPGLTSGIIVLEYLKT